MEYTEVDIKLNPVVPFADILVAKLNEIEFESYNEDENGVKAYVQTHLLNETAVKEIISEVAATRITERGGRADDKRSEAAMEDRKKEGYF
jgi:3'-phosphoadenosine 5'-phosphosulfate sulfotransferase (PAPS reductase)/FAD synthetase